MDLLSIQTVQAGQITVGWFRYAARFSQLQFAPYQCVEAVEFLFFNKNSLFYGVQMHYLMP
jgi:hypothetical protein